MKSKSIFIFLITILILTSCTLIDKSFKTQEIGAWGPIVYETTKISDFYYLFLENQPNIQLEIKPIRIGDQLFLFPVEPLIIGKTYQLRIDGDTKPILENIIVREPCLVYLGDPGRKPEIWKKCTGQKPLQLTDTNGKVQNLAVSRSGEWIFFTVTNESNGVDVWQVKPDGSGIKKIFNCAESTCSDLDFSPMTGKIAFVRTNDKQQIRILDLKDETLVDFIDSGSDLRFSPNGQYLSFLDNSSDELTIIDLANMNRITQQSGAGLVGEWARDSQSILFGQTDYWGGIPGVDVFSLEIKSGELKPLIKSQDQELEFYQPAFSGETDVYLVSVRQRKTGSNKQLWLVKEGGEVVKEITDDSLYYYSFQSWNSDYSKLVFQRYPINTSDGVPHVILWDKSTDAFQVVADNASKPLWLP
jgi:Tol biopolymer transport system component